MFENKDYIVGILKKTEADLLAKMEQMLKDNPIISEYLAMVEDLKKTRKSVEEMQTTMPLAKVATLVPPIPPKPAKGCRTSSIKVFKDRGEKVGTVYGNPIFRNIVMDIMKMEGEFKAAEILVLIKGYQEVTESLAESVPYAYLRFLKDRKVVERGGERKWKINRSKPALILNGATQAEKDMFIAQVEQERDVAKDIGAR